MPTDKRDRQRQNREQKRKREERARRNALLRRRVFQVVWIAVIVAGIVTIANLISGSSTTTTTATTAGTTTTAGTATTGTTSALGVAYDAFRAQETACGGTAPPPAQPMTFDAPQDQHISPDATVTATLSTSCGDIVIQLDQTVAPETVNSFVFLARQGFFDGTVFTRIAPGFVIQAGDPTATGSGGPGYVVPDEYPPAGFAYDRDVLAMANAGPGTTGSQFFIALASTGLDPAYSPLGTVTGGDTTLDTIAAVPVGPSTSLNEVSNPLQTVYIDSVTIDISG
jgi:peptidyl-prolyl cis-trans isomerase B (cyclophilin B)